MKIIAFFLIVLLRGYQFILSPLKTAVFGPTAHCRFTPSCSQYAIEALRGHGVFSGLWLSLKRVGRCHPFGGCGDDPVPSPVADLHASHSHGS